VTLAETCLPLFKSLPAHPRKHGLGVLFNVSGGAVLQRTLNGTGFESVSVLGAVVQPSFELKLEDHAVLDDLKQDRYFYVGETYPILRMGFPETVHSIHSFPVLKRNQAAWVLQIYNTDLSAESVQLLKTFCQHIALSLRTSLKRRCARSKALSIVTDFSIAIGSEPGSPDLYRTILLKTIESMSAEQASLIIFDEASKDLSIKCIKGLNEKLIGKLRLKPGQGIAGFVFETGRPLLIKNIERIHVFKPSTDPIQDQTVPECAFGIRN
jgi:hypothetical protein